MPDKKQPMTVTVKQLVNPLPKLPRDMISASNFQFFLCQTGV